MNDDFTVSLSPQLTTMTTAWTSFCKAHNEREALARGVGCKRVWEGCMSMLLVLHACLGLFDGHSR
eukprot:1154457-Pelagomonas_calceolata.AAC.2